MTAAQLQPPASGNTFRLAANVNSRLDVLSLCESVRRAAVGCSMDIKRVGELSLVVAELATNTYLHGKGGSVSVAVSPTGWTVSARDQGPGFSPAVLADAGRSDRLGVNGVRPLGDGVRSFGSGLASVRRLSTSLSLRNFELGARAVAHKDFTPHGQGAVP